MKQTKKKRCCLFEIYKKVKCWRERERQSKLSKKKIYTWNPAKNSGSTIRWSTGWWPFRPRASAWPEPIRLCLARRWRRCPRRPHWPLPRPSPGRLLPYLNGLCLPSPFPCLQEHTHTHTHRASRGREKHAGMSVVCFNRVKSIMS